jgi:hypothetical protein
MVPADGVLEANSGAKARQVVMEPVSEVAKRADVGRPVVWCWQRRFAEAAVEGPLRDATRKPGSALGRQDRAPGRGP